MTDILKTDGSNHIQIFAVANLANQSNKILILDLQKTNKSEQHRPTLINVTKNWFTWIHTLHSKSKIMKQKRITQALCTRGSTRGRYMYTWKIDVFSNVVTF